MFEFHSDCSFVKDTLTQEVLFHGKTKNGLYAFPTSTLVSAAAFIDERACLSGWDHRLGHPSFRIIQSVLYRFQLQVLSFVASVCSSCRTMKSHALPFNSSTSHSSTPLQLLHTDL